jgi:hypothetical protein
VDGKLQKVTVVVETIVVHDVYEGSVGFVITTSAPVYEEKTLVASGGSGVTVFGSFTADSTLAITTPGAASTGCDALIAASDDGTLLALYDLTLTGSYEGDLTVSFPVDAANNGKEVAIIHHTAGGDEEVTATVTDGKVTGTFSSLSPFGIVTLGAEDHNFRIGDNYYEDLQEAAFLVQAGQTITMLRDVTILDDVFFFQAGPCTFDLGGHTLAGAGVGLGTLEVDSGNVTVKNGSIVADFTDGVAFWVMDGNVTLQNMTISATTGTLATPIHIKKGTLTIMGGEYIGVQSAVYCYDGGKTVIESGHFVSS